METIYIIVIYTIISLIFLIIVGIKLITKRKKEEKEFSLLFSKFLNSIKVREYKEAKKVFDKIKWNSNYTFYEYAHVYKVINLSIDQKRDALKENQRQLLINEVNKICKNKGWTSLDSYNAMLKESSNQKSY